MLVSPKDLGLGERPRVPLVLCPRKGEGRAGHRSVLVHGAKCFKTGTCRCSHGYSGKGFQGIGGLRG